MKSLQWVSECRPQAGQVTYQSRLRPIGDVGAYAGVARNEYVSEWRTRNHSQRAVWAGSCAFNCKRLVMTNARQVLLAAVVLGMAAPLAAQDKPRERLSVSVGGGIADPFHGD